MRAVSVPMRRALGTSVQTIRSAPLLLIDLRTTEGVVGSAYAFCYDELGQRLMREVLAEVATLIRGQMLDADAIAALLARRFRLVGAGGPIGMAVAAVDVALWDALARTADRSLARYIGAEPRPIRAYNSNGLGLVGPAAVAGEAVEFVAEGFATIKLRLGYPTLEADVEAVRAVRSAVGADVEILVDYNQLLAREEAGRRCRALDAYGLGWIEEPIGHDDFAGYAALCEAVATPIQLGENLLSANGVDAAVSAHASDLLMFDLLRIGGVSGWRAAASRAADAGIPVSSHLLPEVSVHLLAATPTCDRLEFVDWAAPILERPMSLEAGLAQAPDIPGTGIAWDEVAVAHYLVD